MFNFRTLVALPPGKEDPSALNTRLSGPLCRSGRFEEAKKSTVPTGNRNSDRLAHSPVIVLTTSNTGHGKKKCTRYDRTIQLHDITKAAIKICHQKLSEFAQATEAINKVFKPFVSIKTNYTQHVQKQWQELY